MKTMQPDEYNQDEVQQTDALQQQTSSPAEESPAYPVHKLVIQPLSSEEDIRSASQAISPEQGPETGPETEDPTPSEETLYQLSEAETSTFIDKPIHPASTAPAPLNLSTAVVVAPKRNWAIPLIGLVFTLAIAGAAAYYFFFFGGIRPGDLVMETIGKTTFLRPQQWINQPSESLPQPSIAFVDRAEVAALTYNVNAAVIIQESQSIPGAAQASDEAVSQIRQEVLRQHRANNTTSNWKCPHGATQTKATDFKEDTKKNASTTGLVEGSFSCVSDDKKTSTKLRFAIGKDGIVRCIVIMATDQLWLKNDAVFTEMLESIEQRQ